MSSKEFCESGKHIYKEADIVRSIFDDNMSVAWIVVCCSKCDSKFLRKIDRPLRLP